MASYVLKILVDLEAFDDLEARQRAAALAVHACRGVEGVREIVLHAQADRKSIRLQPDGSFQDQWKRGGPNPPPGPRAASGTKAPSPKPRG